MEPSPKRTKRNRNGYSKSADLNPGSKDLGSQEHSSRSRSQGVSTDSMIISIENAQPLSLEKMFAQVSYYISKLELGRLWIRLQSLMEDHLPAGYTCGIDV